MEDFPDSDGLSAAPEPSARALRDLSALADGSLEPERAAQLEELIARSPALRERFERERRAVVALRALRADQAPERLRRRLDFERYRALRRPRRPIVYGGALGAAAAAVAAVALILLLPGGTPGSPSVSQAAALSLGGPAMAAPPPDPTRPSARLSQDVEDVYFPNWERSFGWRAAGQRLDRLGGHRAVTVYYQRGDKLLAYTIIAAPPLSRPHAATQTVNGTSMQLFTIDNRLVVTWRRAGDTCVLSGSGVSASVLADLASWKVPSASGIDA